MCSFSKGYKKDCVRDFQLLDITSFEGHLLQVLVKMIYLWLNYMSRRVMYGPLGVLKGFYVCVRVCFDYASYNLDCGDPPSEKG